MSKEIWNYYNNDSGRYLMKANFSDPEIINLEDDDEMGEMLADKVNEVESLKRKLELFDEAVEVIKFLIKTLTILYPLFETMGKKGLSVKEDLQNREKQARQFLKKLGE